MTAALHNHDAAHEEPGADGDERHYPERISVRLAQANRPLYARLADATKEDGITISHRLLALVSIFMDADEDFRAKVRRRAMEIADETGEHSNKVRSISMKKWMQRRGRSVT